MVVTLETVVIVLVQGFAAKTLLALTELKLE